VALRVSPQPARRAPPVATSDAAPAAAGCALLFAFIAADVNNGAHLVGGLDVALHDAVREHIDAGTRSVIQRLVSNVPIGAGLVTCWCVARAGAERERAER
jgi:hypothetical protein